MRLSPNSLQIPQDIGHRRSWGAAHHEEATHDPGCHEAGEGLEYLAHGRVPDNNDPPPCHTLLKVLWVEVVQRAVVRLEHLSVLLS